MRIQAHMHAVQFKHFYKELSFLMILAAPVNVNVILLRFWHLLFKNTAVKEQEGNDRCNENKQKPSSCSEMHYVT